MLTASNRIVVKPRLRDTEPFLMSGATAQQMQEEANQQFEERKSKESETNYLMVKQTPLLNRLVALKNLQFEHFKARSQFYDDLNQIEENYQKKLQELCEKRARIINGTYQVAGPHKIPTSSSSNADNDSTKAPYELRLGYELGYSTKRLPHFWLAVLLNTPVIKNMIERRDLHCLESLNDLRVQYHDDRSFTIEFHFDRNEYFTNAILKKRYYQICTIDKDDPFSYEGPEIYRSEGCAIYWKRGKNLTTIRAVPKDIVESATTSSSEFPVSLALAQRTHRCVDSFFHFFNPPQFPLEKVVVDMELERELTIDFEVGNYLRKRVIPFAGLMYIKLVKGESRMGESRKVSDAAGLAGVTAERAKDL